MKKQYLLKIMILFVIVSCTNEFIDINEQSIVTENTDEIKASLVDGILHFENEDDFKTSIEYMKSLDDEKIEILMYAYYNDGFEPLYPFYKENDEERIKKFVDKKIRRTRTASALYRVTTDEDDPDAYIEPDDDLISDDYFAGLLNFDREIVVDSKLFKYTNEGAFKVDLALKADLDAYIIDNNITELNYPDPDTIEKGLVQVTPTIERYTRMLYYDPCDDFISEPGFGDDMLSNECYSGGGGGSGSGSGTVVTTPDYTESMKDYMKGLEPCDSQSGGIFGWNPFGTSRKCFSYHSDNHRVKTKYWNEDLIFYTSIGVKVKHQKKGWWWYAKKTDEVALVINQAMFAITYPNQIPNYNALPTTSSNNQRLYYYEGRFYDNFAVSFAMATGWTPANDALVPVTPFSENIIVQEYIDLPILRNLNDIEIEAKEINKLFWEKGVWDGVKSLMNRFNEEPKKMTYIVTTPQKVYVNYIDLTQRKLNTKKIVNTLDYDWGGEIKLSWGIDGNGNWTSNINDWGNPLTYFEAFNFTELTDFDTLSMDFIGMTRRGDSWKGSRIVYKKE
ncbi:MAG: hypothetical protein PSN34_16045 [Urechidicola sp.]|nr:hypothetical protein [Urechidicola sp.]